MAEHLHSTLCPYTRDGRITTFLLKARAVAALHTLPLTSPTIFFFLMFNYFYHHRKFSWTQIELRHSVHHYNSQSLHRGLLIQLRHAFRCTYLNTRPGDAPRFRFASGHLTLPAPVLS